MRLIPPSTAAGRVVAAIAVSLFAARIVGPAAPAAADVTVSAPVPVEGLTTTWDLSLNQIRSMDQIPHAYWPNNRHHAYRIYVLTVALKNTGLRMADPFDDLMLALKVTQPQYAVNVASYSVGFTTPQRVGPFPAMYAAATQRYGGVVPWIAAKPGSTTTYTYIINTSPGNSHWGLYNFYYKPPVSKYVFLLNTGI